MAKTILFSTKFPSYHPKKGEPTFFVEKIIQSVMKPNDNSWYDLDHSKLPFDKEFYFSKECKPKHHTIRSNQRWKVGDKFSPRIWSGQPYQSKQITIAPDIEIKKVWDFKLLGGNAFMTGHDYMRDSFLGKIAMNDGLSLINFISWFKQFSENFDGQIICWNENVDY